MKNNIINKRFILLVFTITAFQFYNFFLFGVFAGYFTEQFFPNQNKLISLIEIYSIFTLCFISRPIGGLIFAYLSPKIGKKQVILFTTSLNVVSLCLLGLSPTYKYIGILAPFLVTIFCMLQGFSLGGNLPLINSYIFSHEKEKRALYIGVILAGSGVGILLINLINNLLIYLLPYKDMFSSSWRIAFLIGAIFSCLTFKLRTTLYRNEKVFQKSAGQENPLLQIKKKFCLQLIIGTLAVSLQGTLVALSQVYMLSYFLHILHYQARHIAAKLMLGNIFDALACCLIGYITYKFFNHRTNNTISLIIIATIGLFCIIPINLLILHDYLVIGIIALAFIKGLTTGCSYYVILHLFPDNLKEAGGGLCYNVGIGIFSGLSPVISTFLIYKVHNALVPAYICTITAMITLFILITFKQHFKYT